MINLVAYVKKHVHIEQMQKHDDDRNKKNVQNYNNYWSFQSLSNVMDITLYKFAR